MEERQQENERRTWEVWLHKIWEQSYQEFSEQISEEAGNREKAMRMERVDIEHAAETAMSTLALLKKGGKPC